MWGPTSAADKTNACPSRLTFCPSRFRLSVTMKPPYQKLCETFHNSGDVCPKGICPTPVRLGRRLDSEAQPSGRKESPPSIAVPLAAKSSPVSPVLSSAPSVGSRGNAKPQTASTEEILSAPVVQSTSGGRTTSEGPGNPKGLPDNQSSPDGVRPLTPAQRQAKRRKKVLADPEKAELVREAEKLRKRAERRKRNG